MFSKIKIHGWAVASGLALFFCFPTFHWWPVAWVALVPLFYGTSGRRPVATAVQFFLAGWVFHSLLLQWLITNIFWGGGWALIGYQGLCVALALFWAPMGLAWAWGREHGPRWGRGVYLAALWVAMEWAQAHLFSGFGWSALGYSQGPDVGFSQWASVGGVSLVSFWLVLVNALVALALSEPRLRWVRAGAAVAVVAAVHAGGAFLVQEAEYGARPYIAGVIQPDFAQEMKWDSDYTEEMVRKSGELSKVLDAAQPVDLLVWPEAVVMAHYERAELLRWLEDAATSTQAYLFTGAQRDDYATGKSYNSSVLLDPSGAVMDYYDKVHLAPFGEYMPFDTILPFLRQIVPIDVDAGSSHKVLTAGERRLGPMICFEVLFSDISEELRRKGAEMLVVATNLSWFGLSNAIPQEIEVARFRAIETRLPVIHSANTGISGVIDPWGRLTVVNAVARNGQARMIREAPPNATRMNRLMGALPVASPGNRLLPEGVRGFPILAGIFAAVFLGLAALGWRRGARAGADTARA